MIPRLWHAYDEFCSLVRASHPSGICDLRRLDWVYPTTLLPLGSFLIRTGGKCLPPTNPGVADYISIMFGRRLQVVDPGKTYMPLVPLPRQSTDADRVLGHIYRLHDHGRLCGGESAFKYLIGEMVDNVYQHSHFSNAFVMAQRYENKGFVEVAIVDDGVTIGESLRNAGFRTNEDSDAIVRVLAEGISAKGTDTRGYGIRSNASMFTVGLKGAVLIVSGRGAVELVSSERDGKVRQNNYRLEGGSSSLNGTLVSVRIPYPSGRVDIHDYTT